MSDIGPLFTTGDLAIIAMIFLGLVAFPVLVSSLFWQRLRLRRVWLTVPILWAAFAPLLIAVGDVESFKLIFAALWFGGTLLIALLLAHSPRILRSD